MAATPTPEEIEAARLLVAEADAAEAEAARAAVRAKLQPLIDAGWGGESVEANWADLTSALRTNASALAEIDPNLPNLAFSTAQVCATLNDRLRSLMALNAAPSED